MATEFIAFQPPPGEALNTYDRTQPSESQASTVPRTFREAMEVREEVFVQEQRVPLENELDEDDPRSFHWVVYASVGNASAPSPAALQPVDRTLSKEEERRASDSTATRVPVGTIRLVPPPHEAHNNQIAEHEEKKDTPHDTPTPSSDAQTLTEPYIKLGRLAVLKPYRRLKLSSLLVNSALTWAADHAASILPPFAPANIEKDRLAGAPEQQLWKGLVLVHAQKVPYVIKVWEKWGFVRDEKMGTWVEEGIEHVGLWKRIDLGK